MVYRFELRRNPKSLLVPLISLLLVGASVAIIVLYQPLLGILALAVTGYLSYHMIRFFVNTLRSHIRTDDEKLVCATGIGSDSTLHWADLTHAGWYTSENGYRELFVYAEGDDKLLSIPLQYESMDELAAEIAEHYGELLSFFGEEADGLADALRAHIVPEGDVIDDEPGEDDSAEDDRD